MTTLTHLINERLREAILFILTNIENRHEVGMKKLAKLLYFADFNFYKRNKHSITGEEYIKWHHGPAPKSIYKVVRRLNEEKLVKAEKRTYDDIMKWDFDSVKHVPLKLLSDDEIDELQRTIKKLGHLTGGELENISHKDTPWLVSDMSGEVSYKLVFYRSPEVEKLVE